MLISHDAWPPPYQIKRHRKARSVKLRVLKAQGLVLTVPFRFNLKETPAILEEHKVWITEQLQQWQQSQLQAAHMPQKIIFPALNTTWMIHTIVCDCAFEIIYRPNHEIVFVGRRIDVAKCKRVLIDWIKSEAKKYLSVRLKEISTLTDLPYQALTIRDQQTRWGSCSSQQAINLNYKLIFLPAALIDHVLIHELAHTKILNHSNQFWQLVAHHDTHWQTNRRALRKADQYIPGWV